jgi:hypothetical protein
MSTALQNNIPSNDYFYTQFGQSRIGQQFPLAYIIHQPESMVSISGTTARHIDFSVQTSGTATNTYLPNERCVQLGVGTANADRYTYRQNQYNIYTPGVQQRAIFTSAFGSAITNQTIKIGYFDDTDGAFFYRDGSTKGICLRSSVSGSTVNTLITSFDNTSFSWDPTKDNIYEITFQWLGAGNIQFFINGTLLHTIRNAGSNTTSYMKRGNLPFTCEILNTGVASAGGFVKFFCAGISGEGSGEGVTSYPIKSFSAENPSVISPINTTGRAILTIRPTSTITIGSVAAQDNRGIYVPTECGVFGTTGAGLVELHYDGTLGGSPAFSATTDPGIEFDVASNTVPTGGEIIARRTLDAAVSSTSFNISEMNYPGRCLHNLAFSGQHQLTLVVKANSATINASGWIRWNRIG